MKAEKRARLIREAVDAGRLAERSGRTTYMSIDLVTGMVGGPAVISFPVDLMDLERTGRRRIDLFAIGYQLMPLHPSEVAQ